MKDVFLLNNNIADIEHIPSINIYGRNKTSRKSPKFTIAIPTYKRVNTLASSIESAIFQEGFNDYNIIVVDNNPERGDETELFMKKYEDYPQIEYYKNAENVGMAGNWNKCALLSKADKFVLLHDDDVLSPYAMYCFNVLLERIKDPWSLIKPDVQPFYEDKAISFDKPLGGLLRSLSLLDFSISCGVGAPTCILYNKSAYLSIGGCNRDDDFFPCIDYVNSLNLSSHFNAYRASKCILGGYRIGANASMSDVTMDKYFYNNYIINRQVMKKCGMPSIIIKLVLSSYFDYRVKLEKEYYNMDYYTPNMEGIQLFELNPSVQKSIRFIWSSLVFIYDKFFTKQYKISID